MDLTTVAREAATYAEAYKDKARDDIERVIERVKGLGPVQMAYFCQQVVSHFGEAHTASMALTVFTNMLTEHHPRST